MTGDPRQLEAMAAVALASGRMLMEAGASAKSVEGNVKLIAQGLGAERVELRIGYASLAITIGIGDSGITRMCRVGQMGVNQRLIADLWELGRRVDRRELPVDLVEGELQRLEEQTPRHSRWVVAGGVGLACAAFGRLLGVDWAGTGAVLAAAAAGQAVRSELGRRQVNVFIATALVAFLSSMVAGLGARWTGSATMTAAMIASILLLVPGVPAVNAQSDILEGHPTLGSARAVCVAMALIFIAAGLWLANASLGQWH